MGFIIHINQSSARNQKKLPLIYCMKSTKECEPIPIFFGPYRAVM